MLRRLSASCHPRPPRPWIRGEVLIGLPVSDFRLLGSLRWLHHGTAGPAWARAWLFLESRRPAGAQARGPVHRPLASAGKSRRSAPVYHRPCPESLIPPTSRMRTVTGGRRSPGFAVPRRIATFQTGHRARLGTAWALPVTTNPLMALLCHRVMSPAVRRHPYKLRRCWPPLPGRGVPSRDQRFHHVAPLPAFRLTHRRSGLDIQNGRRWFRPPVTWIPETRVRPRVDFAIRSSRLC